MSLGSHVFETSEKFPPFLKVLFFVEMWERFSYYGMRALLVLFLTSAYGFSDPKAYAVYSIFAAISYTGPVIAGMLADKIMGFRRMIIIGGTIMVFGHLAMAFSEFSEQYVFLGLGLISVGTGFFKGNAANLLGSCYQKEDPERDRGFTLFFISVNVGSVLASLGCGIVGKYFGWDYGFGLAGIGMLCGLLLFLAKRDVFHDHGLEPDSKFLYKKIFFGQSVQTIVILAIVTVGVLASFMIYNYELFSKMLMIFGILALLYFFYITFKSESTLRTYLLTIFVLIIFHTMFFGFELQLGSLMNLFADRNVARVILGWEVPAAFSQSINPFSIIIFGPLLAGMFVKFGYHWGALRFGIGLMCMFLCFMTLYIGTLHADAACQVNYLYLVAGIAFMGVGELFIAPFLQSICTVLSPIKHRGFIMGFYLLSIAFSSLGGFIIAKFVSVPQGLSGEICSTTDSLLIYQNGFYDFMIFNLIVIGAYTVCYPFINKVIRTIER